MGDPFYRERKAAIDNDLRDSDGLTIAQRTLLRILNSDPSHRESGDSDSG